MDRNRRVSTGQTTLISNLELHSPTGQGSMRSRSRRNTVATLQTMYDGMEELHQKDLSSSSANSSSLLDLDSGVIVGVAV